MVNSIFRGKFRRIFCFLLIGCSIVWVESTFAKQTLPAPTLLSPADNIYVRLYELGQVRLEWSAVEGAARYEINIERDTYFKQDFTPNTSYQMPANTFYGIYEWKVRALDAQNVEGEWSETRHIQAVPSLPTETQTPVPTATPDIDFNNDQIVNYKDAFFFSNQWNYDQPAVGEYDLDNDGHVNNSDLLIVINNWAKSKQPSFTPTPQVGVPDLVYPEDDAVITLSGIKDVTFEWTIVSNAVSYTIRFDRNSDGLVTEYGTGTNYYPYVSGFTIDDYKWQVKAHFQDGSEGSFSEKWSFKIISDPTPTPTPTETANPDLNNDNKIDNLDLFIFSEAWKSSYNTGEGSYNGRADFEYDRKIDDKDLLKFMSAWKRRSSDGLAAPALISPENGARFTFFGLNDTVPHNFFWSSVPGAIEYQIVIEPTLPNNQNGKTITLTDTKYYFTLWSISVYIDTYYWKVRAKDESGTWGPWSPTRSFEIYALTK